MSDEARKRSGGGADKHHGGGVLASAFNLVDAVVELYLGKVIEPFVKTHEKFYSALNKVLRKILDDNHVPLWFTANWITYARTLLVVPTLYLIANGWCLVASIICLCVDFGDFLDGVVARYWVDENNKKKAAEESSSSDSKDKRAPSPANSDDDSFGK